MMTDLTTHPDLLRHELGSRWRYGVRQREMLSVLNDIFDQFIPLSNATDDLEADLDLARDDTEPQAELISSRETSPLRGPYCVSFAIRD